MLQAAFINLYSWKRKEAKAMYDLSNPREREMYFQKRQNDLKRVLDTTKSPQQKFNEIMKQQQEEIKYFREKQQQEREQKQQQEAEEKEFLKEVEKTAAEAIENVLKNLFP